MKKTATELAILFNSYPDTDTFHITSDGFAFPEKHNAESHAKTLEDKGIETLQRDAVISAEDEEKAKAAEKAAADKREVADKAADFASKIVELAEVLAPKAAAKKAAGK